jgi:hypothetical protein
MSISCMCVSSAIVCLCHFAKLGDSSSLDVDVPKFEIANRCRFVLVDLYMHADWLMRCHCLLPPGGNCYRVDAVTCDGCFDAKRAPVTQFSLFQRPMYIIYLRRIQSGDILVYTVNRPNMCN